MGPAFNSLSYFIRSSLSCVLSGKAWLVLNRQLESLQEVRLRENNWPQKLQERVRHQLVVSKNLTDTGLEQLLWEKSDVTKSPLSCLSGNSHSRDWWEKLPRTLKLIWDSRVQQLELCRYVMNGCLLQSGSFTQIGSSVNTMFMT